MEKPFDLLFKPNDRPYWVYLTVNSVLKWIQWPVVTIKLLLLELSNKLGVGWLNRWLRLVHVAKSFVCDSLTRIKLFGDALTFFSKYSWLSCILRGNSCFLLAIRPVQVIDLFYQAYFFLLQYTKNIVRAMIGQRDKSIIGVFLRFR